MGRITSHSLFRPFESRHSEREGQWEEKLPIHVGVVICLCMYVFLPSFIPAFLPSVLPSVLRSSHFLPPPRRPAAVPPFRNIRRSVSLSLPLSLTHELTHELTHSRTNHSNTNEHRHSSVCVRVSLRLLVGSVNAFVFRCLVSFLPLPPAAVPPSRHIRRSLSLSLSLSHSLTHSRTNERTNEPTNQS